MSGVKCQVSDITYHVLQGIFFDVNNVACIITVAFCTQYEICLQTRSAAEKLRVLVKRRWCQLQLKACFGQDNILIHVKKKSKSFAIEIRNET